MDTRQREMKPFEIEVEGERDGEHPRIVQAGILIRHQAFRLLQEALSDRQWNDVRELIDLNQLLGCI